MDASMKPTVLFMLVSIVILMPGHQAMFFKGPTKLAGNIIDMKARVGRTIVNATTSAGSMVVNGTIGLASTGLDVVGSIGGSIPLFGRAVQGGVNVGKKGLSAVQTLSLNGLSAVRNVGNAGFNALSKVG